MNVEKPEKITECIACKKKGCMTKYLCHTAPVENALSIIKSGSILSAVKARNVSVEQLKLEFGIVIIYGVIRIDLILNGKKLKKNGDK